MTAVTRSDDAERRLTEALRARATGAGAPVGQGLPTPRAARRGAASAGTSARTALLLALLAGAVLGMVLALLSLWAPGLLPALG